MSKKKQAVMRDLNDIMLEEGISLIEFLACQMELEMNNGTDLADIPSVLHGLSRNVVGYLEPK